MFKLFSKLLRCNHWLKNTVVFIPLIFSLSFNQINACIQATWVFIAFCLAASTVYIFNDIIDIEKNKKHPYKKDRIITSGKISYAQSIAIALFLFCISAIIERRQKDIFINIFNFIFHPVCPSI